MPPWKAPDQVTQITIDFEAGDPVAVDSKKLAPAAMLARLNEFGSVNGIGIIDIVENRFVGMKSRGIYETPGGTILFTARRAMESITLDRGAMHQKDELMARYAELVYNGFWFTPEREMLQAAIDRASERVTGTVRLKLYKGNVFVTGRKSPKRLYDDAMVTFEEDTVYNQGDAEGFGGLYSLEQDHIVGDGGAARLAGELAIVPAGPGSPVSRKHRVVRMEDYIVFLVGEGRQHFGLKLAWVGKEPERLVRVTGEDHLIEDLRLVAGMDEDAVFFSADRPHRCTGPDPVIERS